MNEKTSPLSRLIRFCLEQKLVVLLMMVLIIGWGAMVAPFDWDLGGIPRNPIPVDAIPDIGENQQIVFTKWPGRSPQDIDDQISYPLTVAMLGVPGVKSIRSYSVFGFSSIYVIFNDDVEFYWSRTRILEKLNSLPRGTLPTGVAPALGPDATALGQVFWYTLEGRNPQGNPTGGWDLHELRSAQDWIVRYALLSADGVAEVASVGGYVKEYQIDVDPDAMRAYGVTLTQIFSAVRNSNIDVGARTIEVNKAEYIVRGLGLIESLEDIENIAVHAHNNTPVFLRDLAHISIGPALRRGALDKGGAEAVGGVVVVRYGDNPLRVIKNVKAKIVEIAPGLPSKTLADGTETQITIVPFYDRSSLIYETLGTLNSALNEEVLITIIVVVLMVMHLRSSLLISAMLPLAVLGTFIGMKVFKVDANIVALSGIAIAVGTIVDMGIVVCENMLKRLDEALPGDNKLEVIYRASTEVGSAVLTAVLTTVVSFLPVFTMEAAEGKLFKPLAYTKTFALIASVIIALTVLPPIAHMLFAWRIPFAFIRRIVGVMLFVAGLVVAIMFGTLGGLIIALFGMYYFAKPWIPEKVHRPLSWSVNFIAVLIVLFILSNIWEPLGPQAGFFRNIFFVGGLIGSLLGFFYIFKILFPVMLAWTLRNKLLSLCAPLVLLIAGFTAWQGFDKTFGWMPKFVRSSSVAVQISHAVPGLGKEFMPSLDEGSFLYMPTTMLHASIGESFDSLQKIDMAIAAIPEVEDAVGKIGRAETPLDPAPISMVETVITYKPEYIVDRDGKRVNYKFDEDSDEFVRDKNGELVKDLKGRPFRQWREHIKSPDDIWNEIVKAAEILGTTSAPKLQPIETRIVMLQSGFRAPMGVKVFGPDLESIEKFGLELERLLKEVPSIEPRAVFADRIVGKPYLEIDIDRERIARYGISVRNVQEVIEVAIGGKQLTSTVEGRERYPVRVRYMRELRDQIETLGDILVPAMDKRQIPLKELATINYVQGPQMIKSEDTFLVGYVLLDKKPGYAEVDVVEDAQEYLKSKIASGELVIPEGVSYRFAGAYENQVRAAKRLSIVLPLALIVIFLILYFQFRSVLTTFIVFSGVFLAWSGGFVLIWLYSQPWFLDISILGTNLRDLFQVHPINLSVAVWVGFLALFGIATDNGVVLATFLQQSFAEKKPKTIEEIRSATLAAGKRRARACLMTTATTILALLPVLTSTGRGADIMIPMAIPSFGGMVGALLTLFVVPILYCFVQEARLYFAKLSDVLSKGV